MRRQPQELFFSKPHKFKSLIHSKLFLKIHFSSFDTLPFLWNAQSVLIKLNSVLNQDQKVMPGELYIKIHKGEWETTITYQVRLYRVKIKSNGFCSPVGKIIETVGNPTIMGWGWLSIVKGAEKVKEKKQTCLARLSIRRTQ